MQTHWEVLNLGAGVQSTCIALMIEERELPPIDFAVFADTGSEPKAVMEHLDRLEKMVSFEIHRVEWKSLTEALIAESSAAQSGQKVTGTTSNIPAFTIGRGGRAYGMLGRDCTTRYKIEPIKRFVRDKMGLKPRQRVPAGTTLRNWMGISWDELTRQRDSADKWATNYYPLIEKQMHRHQCLEWMTARGYPEPPRSACTFCPFHSDKEWRRMKRDDPGSFAEAVMIDAKIRGGLPKTEEKLFLHRSTQPLDEVDFRSDLDKGQLSLWGDECAGVCGV